jgi:hypothetical protein
MRSCLCGAFREEDFLIDILDLSTEKKRVEDVCSGQAMRLAGKFR